LKQAASLLQYNHLISALMLGLIGLLGLDEMDVSAALAKPGKGC
jgi:hypothetical protein